MFKCPKCGKNLRFVKYILDEKRPFKRHYFTCECGWNNKPAELIKKEQEAKKAEEAKVVEPTAVPVVNE